MNFSNGRLPFLQPFLKPFCAQSILDSAFFFTQDVNEEDKEEWANQRGGGASPKKPKKEKEVKRVKESTTSEVDEDEEKKDQQKARLKLSEDLAAKKKRVMQKIVHDLPASASASRKPKKRPYDQMKKRPTHPPSKKRSRYDSSDDEMNDWLVNDDEISSENSISPSTSDSEDIVVKKNRSKNVSKLNVSIQLEGKERIMEIQQYKLRLLCSDSSDEEDERKQAKPAIKLEKVGKRIKRMLSDEESDEDNDNRHIKSQPPPKLPSAMAKLPRM